MDIRPPLTRQQVRDVIEFRGCDHIPLMYHSWIWPRFDATQEWNEKVTAIREKYPTDMSGFGMGSPAVWEAPADAPRQRWSYKDKPAVTDASAGMEKGQQLITDLESEVDAFVADFPSPDYAPYYAHLPQALADDKTGRYRLLCSGFCYFERLWSMMGMEPALLNFYTCPDAMHKLMDAICAFWKGQIRNAAAQGEFDGWSTTDDIGQQTGTFFSVEVFNEFFKPRYKELIDECHKHNMHFWLHTCGDIQAFLPGFLEIGLDVIHPIQKYTMDERKIAREWGGKICFWAGFDVQQILPYGTPEQVREEVRFMIDTYGRKDGGLMLTAGNGVTPDNPPENIEALFEESLAYGTDYRKRIK